MIKTKNVKVEPYYSGKYRCAIIKRYQSAFAIDEYAETNYADNEKFVFLQQGSDNELCEIILFAKIKSKITVINELCVLEPEAVNLFCKTIFEKFSDVSEINFNKQYQEYKSETYESLNTCMNDDYIIDLPDDFETYRLNLGKNIRKNLNSSINRSKRDFSDLKIGFYEKENITEALIDTAFSFNKKRMDEKGKEFLQTVEENKRMKEMLQSLGFVTTIEIENRVVAITLNTVVGDELYFHVIAHDPEYNYYRLGQQALYYSIKQFIEKGGKKFHLLWGEYDYKYKFKGDKNLLYTYKIVRPGRILQLVKAKYKADKAMDFLSNLSLKKITFHLKQKLSDIKN